MGNLGEPRIRVQLLTAASGAVVAGEHELQQHSRQGFP